MWLRSGITVAVVQAGSCNSHWTPSLGTSTCLRGGPKKFKKKKKRERERDSAEDPKQLWASLTVSCVAFISEHM